MMALAGIGIGWIGVAFAISLGAAAFVAVAVASGAAARLDARVLAMLRVRDPLRADGRPRRLTTAARDLTALGGDTLRIVALLACLVALGCDRRWRIAGALLGIFAMARLVLFGLKAMVRRPRPPAIGETVATYTTSFPSGHTFMAGVLYLSAALLIPTGPAAPLLYAAVGGALLVSLAIGLTRVAFGIHWPSDVVAGWLAAIAWTCGSVLLLARIGVIG